MIIASDLEGTLTRGETWRGVAQFLALKGLGGAYRSFFWRRFPKALAVRLGFGDKRAFQNQWIADLALLFARLQPPDRTEMAAWVVQTELWPQRRQEVLAELLDYRQKGAKVILCSGTYQPILEAFAAKMGLGIEAIGTPVNQNGQVIEAVNAGEAKAQRLWTYLKAIPLDLAYGDSMADVPMFTLAKQAVAVYPDGPLEVLAKQKGWRVWKP